MPEQTPGVLIASPAQRIAANGLVPTHLPVPADLPTDTVDARRFSHPCLPGRVVIRLVPDVMADGAALEMARMGFAFDGFADDIARRRRQALGFPAQALMIDPARAHHALDRMDQFREHAARVTTKPGHARDGFTALAAELEGVAPHFLPSYWEQAGRAFMEQGNLQFAASCFDRARAAERAHGLTVDPRQQADAWLEFALGGALTVKALQAHGKELAAQGREGFLRFLDLCARRTLGGLQPWSAMLADLRRAAKAAKVPQAECDDALLTALIGAPVLAKSTQEFWTELREPLVGLARRDERVRTRLLQMLPEPRSGEDAFPSFWLKLLEDAGALEQLEAQGPPHGSLAAWFGRFVPGWRHSDGLLLLFRRLAPRLRAAGEPVDLLQADWNGADAMMIDEALELGVPLAPPKADENSKLNLDRWADDFRWEPDEEGAVRPLVAQARPLDHIVADPAWRGLLVASVSSVGSPNSFHKAAAGLASMAAARLEAALGLAAEAGEGGVHAVTGQVSTFSSSAFDLLQSEFPEVKQRLERIRPAAALQTTLRLGLAAELAWPAWEQAVAELRPGGEVEITGTPYAPVVYNSVKAIVLGPTDRVLTVDLHTIDGSAPDPIAFADGQLLCSIWSYPKRKTYWSGDPSRIIEFDNAPTTNHIEGHPGPSGGLVMGRRELRAGDSAAVSFEHVLSDGQAYWVREGDQWKPFDPRSGTLTEGPLPAFAVGAESWPLQLRAVPAGSPGAVVGCAGGLYGFRYRQTADGVGVYEQADGRGVVIDDPRQTRPDGLITLPGQGAPLVVDVGWRGSLTVYEPGARRVLGESDGPWGVGWRNLPPFALWHFLAPRDPAGSSALRAASVEQAEALIAAAQAHPKDEGPDLAALMARVAEIVPGLTAPELLEAVAAQARAGAALAKSTAALLRGERADADEGDEDDEDELPAIAPDHVMQAFCEPAGVAYTGHTADFGRALQTAGAWLRGEAVKVTTTALRWETSGDRWRAMVFVGSVGSDEQRQTLARALEVWADSGLVMGGVQLRRAKIRVPGRTHAMAQVANPGTSYCDWPAPIWTFTEADHRYICSCDNYDDDGWDISVIEAAGADGFAVPTGGSLLEEGPVQLPEDAAQLRRAAEALRTNGARAVADADVQRLADEVGLPMAAARLLLWGHPRGSSWKTDSLGPELRGRMGMKVADVKVGDQALAPLLDADGTSDRTKQAKLFADAVQTDAPEALWADPAGLIARIAAGYRSLVGARVQIPEELLKTANAVNRERAQFLEVLLNPSHRPRWTPTQPGRLSADGFEALSERVCDVADVESVLNGVAWLLYVTPAGDPVRAGLGALVEELLACVNGADFVLDIGSVYTWDAKDKARGEALMKAMDAPEQVFTEGEGDQQRSIRAKDDGSIVLVQGVHHIQGYLRPARCADQDGPVLKAALGLDPDMGRPTVARWRAARSPAFRAAVARGLDPAVPAGTWDQDPRRSAPETVRAAMDAHGLTEDSATLYLQVLALPDPTKKRVLEWNGWKAPAYAKAEAPLIERGLLTAGKRPRAGREHFLPGGWEALGAPDLPIEKWKLPLYQWKVGGVAVDVVEPLVPLEPVGDLFRRAWARVTAGDAPRLGGE
jgi:hypothetical protein